MGLSRYVHLYPSSSLDRIGKTAFGFAASLLEGIPIIGLFLSISNRIGAAMW